MIEVGRVCVKTAGRDAGKQCVVVDVLDKNYVLVDGQTRRRKVNLTHLEPVAQVLGVSKGASHEEVVTAFRAAGWEVPAGKPRQKPARPRPVRTRREKETAEVKPGKKKLDEKVKEPAKKPQQPSPDKPVSSAKSKSKLQEEPY